MIKELTTRIALKHDSYENWMASTIKLLPGEIAICEFPGTTKTTVDDKGNSLEIQTPPTVLFKVGTDGETTFKDLPWASAKAADVYDWAKAKTAKLKIDYAEDGKTETSRKIVFLDANNQEIANTAIDLSDFATDADIEGLNERLAAAEAALGFGGGDNSLVGRVKDLEDAVDILNGKADEEGSIAKAIAESAIAITEAYEEYADQAEADAIAEAKKYVDETVVPVQAQKDAAQDAAIQENTRAIETEALERAGAINNINKLLGAGFSEEATVYAGIAAANVSANQAKDMVNGLSAEGGGIYVNAANIATNTANIAKNAQAIADEKTAREGVDERLQKVEAFFEAADHDGEAGGLNDALDTLVEIQSFLNGEGKEVDQILDAIADNAEEIVDLKEVVGFATYTDPESGETITGEGLAADLATAEQNIAAISTEVSTLNTLVDGIEVEEGAIKKAIEAAHQAGAAASAAAAVADGKAVAAQEAADSAQEGVNTLADILNGTDGNTGLVKAVEANTAQIAALTSANYLRTEDFLAGEFIFNCGNASTIAHTTTNIPAAKA